MIGGIKSLGGSLRLALALLLCAANMVVAQAQSVRFAVIGDFGVDNADEAAVADLIELGNVDLIVTVGDNNYPDGELSTIDANIGKYFHSYIYPYLGNYGAGSPTGENRFFPALGNHDWVTGNVNAHLLYFTLPGNERYYDFVRGPVHFFIVDSDNYEPDGKSATGIQGQWLQGRLAESTSPFNFVFFHHPPYSSGDHGGSEAMRWPFAEWGADAVFSGHDHLYERINRDGIVYFINGLGGQSNYDFGAIVEGSQVQFNDAHGAMLVTADSSTAVCQFYTVSGALIDSVTLSAGSSNTPPVANHDAATIPPTTVSGNVMLNDSDPDNDPIMLISCTQPPNGTVVDIGNGSGTLQYTPDPGFAGQDIFSYTISDGNGGTDTAMVTLTVLDSGNTAPIAVNDSATIPNTTVSGNVMLNDYDPDNDPITLINHTQPANGTVTDIGGGNGLLRYTPDPGFSGLDVFTYMISDGRGGIDSATVTLNVQ